MWRNIRWKEIFDGSRLSFRGSIYLNDNYSYLRKFPLHWHLSPIFKKLFLPLESIPPRDIPWYPVYTRSIIYKRVYISKKKKTREKKKKTKLAASKLFQVVTNSDQNETQKRKYFINKYLLYRESELPMKENLIQLYPPRTRPVWIDRPIHRSFHDRSIVRRNYSAYVTGC